MSDRILPTSVVGSYPQPDWLIDREKLKHRLPPRVQARELWRVAEPFLEQAQNDATIVAIRDQERAGLDIITDGEIRRESYSNRIANALGGIDIKNPGTALDRTGHPNPVPRVTGPIHRARPIEVHDVEFLRLNTDHTIKITLPGPFTLTQQAQNDFYPDDQSLAMAYAEAINEEIKELFAAGADIIQLDEPYMQARPEQAKEYAVKAINRALDGVNGTSVIHLCFGYAAIVKDKPSSYSFLSELADCTVDQISIEAAQPQLDLSILERLPSKSILVGVIDMADESIETPDAVAERIRRALDVIPPERLIVAPDCGMKYLDRGTAFGKLKAMVQGAEIVRAELG